MMKLLIIDDEPNVRQGLRGIIDWGGLGFEQIGEAQDGEEGLAKLLATHPDLTLLDIRMPKKNGLQLIQEARSAGFQGEVIMLSGYSDFEYARKAIRSGVGAYLLKPIDEVELEIEVKRVIATIARRRESRRIGTLFEKNAIHTALIGLIVGSLDDEQQHFLPDALFGPEKRYRVGILRGNIALSANELLSYCGDDSAIFIASLGSEAALFSVGTEDEFAKILRLDFPEGGVCLYISEPVASLNEVPAAYRVAKGAADNHAFYAQSWMENGWLVREVSKELRDVDGFERLDRDRDDIMHCLSNLDQERLLCKLCDKEAELAASCAPAEQVRGLFMALLTQVTDQVQEQHPQLSGAFSTDAHRMEQIHGLHTLRALILYVQAYLVNIIDQLKTETDTDVVARMRNHISVHYADKLKIETLAAKYGYNSAYLGKLFRSETGYGFNAYVEMVRMNRAKQLLVDTGLKVYEVAERVGFSDVDYFYRKFTTHTGESPREYQRRMGKMKS